MLKAPTRSRPAWAFLDLDPAPASGPLAFGDDLSPQALIDSYRRGLYPFPSPSLEQTLVNEVSFEPEVAAGRIGLLPGSTDPYSVSWHCPDPRPVISVLGHRPQKSMRSWLRNRTGWHTTVDTRFEEVVHRCREDRPRQWLTDDLLHSLVRLNDCGYAHSIEVWDDDELIGGVFGLRIGGVFSADSQFTRREGAGKVAVWDLVRRFADAKGKAVDVQYDGDYVRLLGARPMPREQYLSLLRDHCVIDPLPMAQLPVSRLASPTPDTRRTL